MKFMLHWNLHPDTRHETLEMFANMTQEQEAGMMGDKVKLIGRWHDLVGGTGVAIFEAESAEALAAYSLNWNRHMDLEATPVTDDDETKRIGLNLV